MSKPLPQGEKVSRLLRGTAREQTLETLRNEIITLHLAPGVALSENELAAEHGVSRTPVRESLILLQGEGLVQVYPQVGTFVSLVDPERVAEAQFIREAIEWDKVLDDVRVAVVLDQAAWDESWDSLQAAPLTVTTGSGETYTLRRNSYVS